MTSLRDTSGSELVRQLAAERRHSGVASGLALTLMVSVDEADVPVVEEAVTLAAAYHPFRLLLVTRMAGQASRHRDRLDAEVVVGGRFGGCEAVTMRMQGRLALHSESVVLPLLAPDVPAVTWWHGPPPDRISTDPLGVAADRRITDSAQSPDPTGALRQRAVDYAAGDTDLAWTRITGWRSLMAAALDGDAGRPVTAATVTADPQDTGAKLLSGWLQDRLGIVPRREDVPAGLRSVRLESSRGDPVTVTRERDVATLAVAGGQTRTLPLTVPTLGELISEELRRLNVDRIYAAALAAATGVTDLHRRPARRVHTWVDPEEADL